MTFETILRKLGSQHIDLQREWRDTKDIKLYRIVDPQESFEVIIQFAVAFLLSSDSLYRLTVISSHRICWLEQELEKCNRKIGGIPCNKPRCLFKNKNELRILGRPYEEFDIGFRGYKEFVIVLDRHGFFNQSLYTPYIFTCYPIIGVATVIEDFSEIEQMLKTKTKLEKSAITWKKNKHYVKMEERYALEESLSNMQI